MPRPYFFLPFLVFAMIAGCQMHDSGVTVQSLLEAEGPTSESWDPVMHISENGLPRLKMTAAYMARFETQDSTYLVLSALSDSSGQVRVDIFDTQGDSSATVYANRILYFERDRRFEANGHITVQARDDRWLFAEHLAWSEKTARIQTPGFSTIKTPKQTLSGYGLDADENLYDFSMARVSGTVITEDE
jgi:hypothetical protein